MQTIQTHAKQQTDNRRCCLESRCDALHNLHLPGFGSRLKLVPENNLGLQTLEPPNLGFDPVPYKTHTRTHARTAFLYRLLFGALAAPPAPKPEARSACAKASKTALAPSATWPAAAPGPWRNRPKGIRCLKPTPNANQLLWAWR